MKRVVLLSVLIALVAAEVGSDIMLLAFGKPIDLWEKYTVALVFAVISIVDNKRDQGE